MGDVESGRDLVLQALLDLPSESQQKALSWLLGAISKPSLTPLPHLMSGSSRRPAVGALKLHQQEALTPREAMVLSLVAQGESMEGVAANMGISRSTVRNHLRNVVAKLNVPNEVTEGGSEPEAQLTAFPVRLPRDQYTALKAWCLAHEFSMATVVRGLVERFLEDQEPKSA